MGNCCGKRRFPYPARVIGQRCSSNASSGDENNPNAVKSYNLDGNNNPSNQSVGEHKSKSASRSNERSLGSLNDRDDKSNNRSTNFGGSGVGDQAGTGNSNAPGQKGSRDKDSNKSQNSKKSGKGKKGKNHLDDDLKSNKKSSAVNYNFHDDNHKSPLKRGDSLKSSSSSSIGSNLQFIQHIRDREEPEEIDVNLHPFDLSAPQTFFLQKALEDKRKLTASQNQSNKDCSSISAIAKAHRYKKYSSCSNMIMDDSTLSRPNQKAMVKCVALALYYHIRHRRVDRTGKNFYPLFDEKEHPLTKEKVPDDYYKREPDHKSIYKFLRQLFTSAQLNAECAIIMLVYLERIMSYGELRIDPSNWKRLLLGSVLLASKVWDDQAVWNVDYCQILKELTVEDMNALERHYLDLLQFNINIGSSVYAKYYFDLRHLAVHAGLIFNTHPLTKKRAQKLDASNRLHIQKHRDHRASHILPTNIGLKNQASVKSVAPVNELKAQPSLDPTSDFKHLEKILLHRSHSCDEHLEKKMTMYVFS